jgi:mannonate dehydratase
MRFAITTGRDPYSTENLRTAKQLGCTDIIGRGPILEPGDEVWEFGDLVRIKSRVEDFGLRLDVLEDGPRIEKIMLGLPDRDEQLENFRTSLRNIAAAGIKVIKPQHMPPNWIKVIRTSDSTPTRGGATSTSFDYELVKNAPTTEYGEYTEDQIWDGLAYFLKGAVPVAEEVGVKISLHPDDPPISPIQGFARILRSVEAFDRMLEIVPSDNVGLLFCQGCFAEMGADIPAAIRHFGSRKKIFFVHFRDVKGAVPTFQEVFHDDGKTDMLEAMRAYHEVGFEGPMRPDHGAAMEGDDSWKVSKIFALGYMRGLLQCVEQAS